ncbi:uncharacterized protein KD926_000672 [Aspergillus affinis]|uniref:uncharacterized protein n=1 Tax=Aspergillus affinis TaxID=1070780 RepID=UPI0022FDE213|nr:uncharacterized protein KD926_000672 [Aspergillus affinis]KAI9037235.1 hypothetical protein KD926_000672 [Aspergillus affinis]
MPEKLRDNLGPHPVYRGDVVKVIRELHQDLSRKWKLYEKEIRETWQRCDKRERQGILIGQKAGGLVLDSYEDESRGEMGFLIPEWNLQDLADPDSDLLLDLIQHRATNWLSDQYLMGSNNELGDEKHILEIIECGDTPYEELENENFRCFASEYHYGEPVHIPEHQRHGPKGKDLPRCTQPEIIGNFILARQMHFLQMMNLVIWEMLALHWKREKAGVYREKPQGPGTAALIALCIREKNPKIDMSRLADMASDNKRSLDDWAWLCRTDPEYLIDMIYIWFLTQPGLIADADDLLLPTMHDKNVSSCLFEMLHTFVLNTAIWDYITRLLRALADAKDNDRFYRTAILQELVNVIHFEYERSQELLKRYTQRSIGHGHLKRVDGPNHAKPRVVLTTEPARLTRSNPIAHYILRLYQSETKVADAGYWLQKIFSLYISKNERVKVDDLAGREVLHELAVVTGLFRHLKSLVQLPPSNPRKGRKYINRVKAMNPEIESIKESLDLSELAVPPDRLRCPGVTFKALNKVDEVIESYTGTDLAKLYEEVNESCFQEIRRTCDEKKAQAQKERESITYRFPMFEASSKDVTVRKRKQKPKTRPTECPVQASTEQTYLRGPRRVLPQIPVKVDIFKVKPESYEVFTTLLSRTEPRGSLSWMAFSAAMTDVGFSVDHKYGSIVTFEPQIFLSHLKSFTFHRPHESHIEGFRLLWLARRLKRVYDWSIDCFEVV